MKGLLVAIVLGSLLALPLVPRFGQDPTYHDFADQRELLGVPHFWNVVSNLLLVVVGATGLARLRRTGVAPDAAITDPRERPAWAALFIGCLLTGLGSSWYHLDPHNGSLMWDRLLLGVTSVSVGLIVLQERLSLVWVHRLFWPAVGFALASVPWWSITESYGRGDLRPYGWCLAVPCVVVVIGAFLPPRYTGGGALWAAIGLYAAARGAEVLDDQIMALPLLWSGHTWKHLLAGAAVWVFVRWLSHRRPLPGPIPFEPRETLKRDLFGVIERGVASVGGEEIPAVRRHLARAPFLLRPVARLLARREARALERLHDVERVPHLLARQHAFHLRTWIDGEPINRAQPTDPAFYAGARRLLRKIHRAGVTHNDTHKGPNWLVTPDGHPALLDFQLATRHQRRSRWFRLCALEDIRHLLKHKRRYRPDALTSREKAILAKRSWPARWWRRTGKPVYRWFTRRVLRWRDDEGRGMLD